MTCTAAPPAGEVTVPPDLDFHVESAESEAYSVAPLLNFKLKIEQAGDATSIHAIALRCQIRIEPARRRYTGDQQEQLRELFGLPAQWKQTLRPMLWTHASTIVPSFTGGTVATLPVPCTYDFNIAATKYFGALGEDGEIPLCLLFSGTVFYQTPDSALQTAPISWEKEADFKLPARVWRQMMEQYYPNSAWLCLEKDAFDRLQRFKISSGHITWEQTLDELLQSAQQKVAQ
jgi:hypothetical protein